MLDVTVAMSETLMVWSDVSLGRRNDSEAPVAAHPLLQSIHRIPKRLPSHSLIRFRPGSRLECFQSPSKGSLGLSCCGCSNRFKFQAGVLVTVLL